jgi:dolichyl-phosphate-mannose-protein mannosyltransferase
MGLVPSSGDHDLLLSPEFKYSLEGNDFEPTQPSKLVLLFILICYTNFAFFVFFKIKKEIAYGSSVVIKHRNTGGGYLHTHKVHYSTGSKRMLIECFIYIYAIFN